MKTLRTSTDKLIILLLVLLSSTALAFQPVLSPPHRGLNTTIDLVESVTLSLDAGSYECPEDPFDEPLVAEYGEYFTVFRCYVSSGGLDMNATVRAFDSAVGDFNRANPNISGFTTMDGWSVHELNIHKNTYVSLSLAASVELIFHEQGAIYAYYYGFKLGNWRE